MKNVKLESLTLRNFKGEKERTTEFNKLETSICGGNGLGKTRHFNAFLWLLFGKDTADRKDFEVKTRVNGEELHQVECSVTGTINVDGERIVLKRALIENWVKPRGQAEQVLKGNVTECSWNETPISVTEFSKRVDNIITSDLFKMITNPQYFVNLPWKKQREQLFEIAGTASDEELANLKPQFRELLDRLTNKPLDDYKKEIAAKKKRIKAELEQVQPRIEQTQKMMPEAEDFAALEQELESLNAEIKAAEDERARIAKEIRAEYEADRQKQEKINAIRKECAQFLYDQEEKEKARVREENAARTELEFELKKAQKSAELCKADTTSAQLELARLHREIDNLTREQEELRDKWYKVNGEEYKGETTCPHCGQELPESMLNNAKELFNKRKMQNCDEINTRGVEIGKQIELKRKSEAEVKQDVDNALKTAAEFRQRVASIQEKLDKMPIAQPCNVKSIPSVHDFLMQKDGEIKAIEATISEEKKADAGTDNTDVLMNIVNKRNDVISRLANKEAIAKAEEEIQRLADTGKKLAQEIADIERDEFTIQEFVAAKIEEAEKRINGMFSYVTFKLFDYTLDNNPVEVCTPLINGVPFAAANDAAKVNAGLDIIKVLSKFYGCAAPIFIDGRESVNEIIDMGETQIINLIVTRDKILIIK